MPSPLVVGFRTNGSTATKTGAQVEQLEPAKTSKN